MCKACGKGEYSYPTKVLCFHLAVTWFHFLLQNPGSLRLVLVFAPLIEPASKVL